MQTPQQPSDSPGFANRRAFLGMCAAAIGAAITGGQVLPAQAAPVPMIYAILPPTWFHGTGGKQAPTGSAPPPSRRPGPDWEFVPAKNPDHCGVWRNTRTGVVLDGWIPRTGDFRSFSYEALSPARDHSLSPGSGSVRPLPHGYVTIWVDNPPTGELTRFSIVDGRAEQCRFSPAGRRFWADNSKRQP